MSSSPHQVGIRALRALALGVLLLAAAAPALAAKWRFCPSKLGYQSSRIGAVTAPFIHPGHEIGIFLSRKDVSVHGAFSTEPEGNEVSITYASLFGAPIELPPLRVAAVSEATLYFDFPDTREVLGRPLAGPVHVLVRTGDRVTAEILPRHLVALPPATDVGQLFDGALQQTALAAMDTRGAIWVPIEFAAFGTMEKTMMCPGTFTPLRSFGVGLTVRSTPAFLAPGAPVPRGFPPLRRLSRLDLYLGDFRSNGTNYYGVKMNSLRVSRIPRGFGVRLCGRNDAVDVVLRAPGWQRFTKPWSPFAAWMPDSQPLALSLSQLASDLPTVTTSGLDALGQLCELD